MNDPRHSSYIVYSQSVLNMMLIMKAFSGIASMRQMNHQFNEDAAIQNLKVLSNDSYLMEMPDWQTANNYLEQLPVQELEQVRCEMVRTLIRTKQFYPFTMDGRYCVIIDGTDIAYFKKKHCEHDLVKKVTNKKTGETEYQYYHKVLEAKIVLGPGILASVATEFIENEDENVSKQDCELRAAYRLLNKLKKEFPKLQILIISDALFCTIPFMTFVKSKNWDYLFRIKSGRQEKLMEDFEDLLRIVDDKDKVSGIYEEENGIGKFVNHVEEVTNKKEICNMFRYTYQKAEKTNQFDWLTNIEITRTTLSCMIKAGRSRWKIENEGFNVEKNGIYHLEHHNSLNYNAMKNHYIITQIAHMLMQLYMAFDHIVHKLNESITNTASDLLNSIRSLAMTEKDIAYAEKRTALHMCCLLSNLS